MAVDWADIEGDDSHRPWKKPKRSWVMTMSWVELLAAHWPVQPELLEPEIPQGLTLETFDGSAWISLIPFAMDNVYAKGLTWAPFSMRFPELNVRTYVSADGKKPGVWFFSLDAASRLTVTGARTFFYLPYFNADMAMDIDGDTVTYQSRRTHRGAPEARFRGSYCPVGRAETANRGTLDYWLMERYCLYSARGDTLYRGDVHHRPWQLRRAEADIEQNTMFEPLGLELDDPPERIHYAKAIHTLGWTPQKLS